MDWSTNALREAARKGDYGRVVKISRTARKVSQRQLGEACGLRQSAVSRLEGRGNASYDMTQLARVAAHLKIPARLVGLAEHMAMPAAPEDGTEDVERREFLAGTAAAVTSPALAALGGTPAHADADTAAGGRAAALRLATSAYRRMDGTTSSRRLSEAVQAHLRLTQAVAGDARGGQRARLAAVGSEAASFAGWLAWDMGDYGSARTWYGTAVSAARNAGDPLLSAYQVGSLAQFESYAGNAQQGLSLVDAARHHLGADGPGIADAWLATVEALAHAAGGDRHRCERALGRAARSAERIPTGETPPWPWVFSFSAAKVAAARITCGARLGLAGWVFGAQDEAAPVWSSGHDKARALHVLDIASAHLAAGRPDAAFMLGAQAVETGVRYRSGRIIERARALRRSFSSSSLPRVVRDFDDRLYGVYL
ncbi:helix-turn-helix domain-containing protein [Streptomyces smyrnaeus]|uniref:helix-turn-helix domain-containing protein n=1 Tax=Streptomyces smyrnaeus TaxID=1387713 RepID=UPI0037B075AC